jgi:hypothetical protein
VCTAVRDHHEAFTPEGNVSERNGDKARFHRQRKSKILHRTRIRELREGIEDTGKEKPQRGTVIAAGTGRNVILDKK